MTNCIVKSLLILLIDSLLFNTIAHTYICYMSTNQSDNGTIYKEDVTPLSSTSLITNTPSCPEIQEINSSRRLLINNLIINDKFCSQREFYEDGKRYTTFVMDSGCTNHIVRHHDFLSDIVYSNSTFPLGKVNGATSKEGADVHGY